MRKLTRTHAIVVSILWTAGFGVAQENTPPLLFVPGDLIMPCGATSAAFELFAFDPPDFNAPLDWSKVDGSPFISVSANGLLSVAAPAGMSPIHLQATIRVSDRGDPVMSTQSVFVVKSKEVDTAHFLLHSTCPGNSVFYGPMIEKENPPSHLRWRLEGGNWSGWIPNEYRTRLTDSMPASAEGQVMEVQGALFENTLCTMGELQRHVLIFDARPKVLATLNPMGADYLLTMQEEGEAEIDNWGWRIDGGDWFEMFEDDEEIVSRLIPQSLLAGRTLEVYSTSVGGDCAATIARIEVPGNPVEPLYYPAIDVVCPWGLQQFSRTLTAPAEHGVPTGWRVLAGDPGFSIDPSGLLLIQSVSASEVLVAATYNPPKDRPHLLRVAIDLENFGVVPIGLDTLCIGEPIATRDPDWFDREGDFFFSNAVDSTHARLQIDQGSWSEWVPVVEGSASFNVTMAPELFGKSWSLQQGNFDDEGNECLFYSWSSVFQVAGAEDDSVADLELLSSQEGYRLTVAGVGGAAVERWWHRIGNASSWTQVDSGAPTLFSYGALRGVQTEICVQSVGDGCLSCTVVEGESDNSWPFYRNLPDIHVYVGDTVDTPLLVFDPVETPFLPMELVLEGAPSFVTINSSGVLRVEAPALPVGAVASQLTVQVSLFAAEVPPFLLGETRDISITIHPLPQLFGHCDHVSGATTLQWASLPGWSYLLQSCDDLNGQGWIDVGATDPVSEYDWTSWPGPLTEEKIFYRLRCVRPE